MFFLFFTGTVCSEDFSPLDANVFCRMMGIISLSFSLALFFEMFHICAVLRLEWYSRAGFANSTQLGNATANGNSFSAAYVSGTLLSYAASSLPVLLSRPFCAGSESNIDQCTNIDWGKVR